MPAAVSYNPAPAIVAAVLFSALVLGFAAAVRRYRRTRRGGAAVVAIALGVCLGVLSAGITVGAYQSYVIQNTWRFSYYLGVQENGDGSGSIIVPVPKDERLLADLRLETGTANWSLLNTSVGRGLFVRFTGGFDIETYVSVFPPPVPGPDTTPSMGVPSNCTAGTGNCTGRPSVWVYYSGPENVSFGFSTSWWYLNGNLKQGWATYETTEPPVPLAAEPRTFL